MTVDRLENDINKILKCVHWYFLHTFNQVVPEYLDYSLTKSNWVCKTAR